MKAEVYRGSWIVTIPLVAAAAAYFMLVFLPANRAIGEARQEIKRKQETLAQSAGLPEILLSTQRKVGETQSYVAVWERRAPTPQEQSSLHGRVHALAQSAGITTTRFDPEPVVTCAAICKIPITVGCSGSFGQICDFIELLEREPAKIWIEYVNIEKLDGDKEGATGEIKLVAIANNLKNSNYAEHAE